MPNRYVVIMAGGSSAAFWPWSRQQQPKHLLPLVGEQTLLVQTIERLLPMVPVDNLLIVTGNNQAQAIRDLCPMLPPENVIAEPVGRHTAPAVGLALLLIRQRDPEAVFAMLPADHAIRNTIAFRNDLDRAFSAAERAPLLVTLGIRPTEPATEFGYIHRGPVRTAGEALFDVLRFVEKPSLELAQGYLATREYFWNAGMFVWRATVLAEAFAKHAPELWGALSRIDDDLHNGQPLAQVLDARYPGLPTISIDHALLEKATNVAMIPAHFDWGDVGAWASLMRESPADPEGNVVRGLTAIKQSSGNLVVSAPDHLVAVLGVRDFVVIHTPDVTLVCPRGKTADIDELMEHCESAEALQRFL